MISKTKFVLIILAFLIIRKLGSPFKRFVESYRRKKLKLEILIQEVEELTSIKNKFIQNFVEGREKGAQLTLTVNGRVILDLHAGRDEKSVLNGLSMIFSSTKVIESLIVAMLVDRNKLRYEEPIAKYWPEFGEKFSQKITLADLMKHRAGLSQIHTKVSTSDAVKIFNSIHAQEKWILENMKLDIDAPVTRYHAITRGIIVDTIIYKVDGRRAKEFIQDEILSKVTNDDDKCEFYLGCPESKQQRMVICERAMSIPAIVLQVILQKTGIAKFLFHPGVYGTEEDALTFDQNFLRSEEVSLLLDVIRKGSIVEKTFNLFSDVDLEPATFANHKVIRSLPLLSVCGITNSRTLAKIGAELACGGTHLLSERGLKLACESNEPVLDEVLKYKVAYTNCGWGAENFESGWVGWDGSGGR